MSELHNGTIWQVYFIICDRCHFVIFQVKIYSKQLAEISNFSGDPFMVTSTNETSLYQFRLLQIYQNHQTLKFLQLLSERASWLPGTQHTRAASERLFVFSYIIRLFIMLSENGVKMAVLSYVCMSICYQNTIELEVINRRSCEMWKVNKSVANQAHRP